MAFADQTISEQPIKQILIDTRELWDHSGVNPSRPRKLPKDYSLRNHRPGGGSLLLRDRIEAGVPHL